MSAAARAGTSCAQAAASISFNNHIHDALAANYKVCDGAAAVQGCVLRAACA